MIGELLDGVDAASKNPEGCLIFCVIAGLVVPILIFCDVGSSTPDVVRHRDTEYVQKVAEQVKEETEKAPEVEQEKEQEDRRIVKIAKWLWSRSKKDDVEKEGSSP